MSAQNAASPGSGANSDIRHRNAALLSIENELPPLVVSSDYFDEQLADTYKRLRMPKGLLERLAGIRLKSSKHFLSSLLYGLLSTNSNVLGSI